MGLHSPVNQVSNNNEYFNLVPYTWTDVGLFLGYHYPSSNELSPGHVLKVYAVQMQFVMNTGGANFAQPNRQSVVRYALINGDINTTASGATSDACPDPKIMLIQGAIFAGSDITVPGYGNPGTNSPTPLTKRNARWTGGLDVTSLYGGSPPSDYPNGLSLLAWTDDGELSSAGNCDHWFSVWWNWDDSGG